MSIRFDVMAEEMAQRLIDEWHNGGQPFYEREFVGLHGLPKDARVIVSVRLIQPLRLTMPVEWGARVPVGAGT